MAGKINRQLTTDRLDPVLVDERHHRLGRRSAAAGYSAWAKYAEAFRRISLARFSSRFSRSSSLRRSRSSLVKAATESLHQWDGLVARVLKMEGNYIFSGAMLPLSPDLAARIQSVLGAIPEQTRQLVEELIEQGEMDAPPDNLDDMIHFTQESELANVAFLVWAMDVYIQTLRPPPSFRDMDN